MYETLYQINKYTTYFETKEVSSGKFFKLPVFKPFSGKIRSPNCFWIETEEIQYIGTV